MMDQAGILTGVFLAWLWQWACDHTADLFMGFIGFLGCCVAVATGRDKGEPQSKARIFSIFITGEVLCISTSKALVATFHIDPGFTVAVGFVVAIMGMRAIDRVMVTDPADLLRLVFPFLKGLGK